MDDTAKYLIHADVTADGVVERSDVVGAIFGQTEGLLGDDLDLRALQQTSRVGRIDVEIESQAGTSVGEVTIASRLDRVETAILAAALETIDRVGPCAATIRVSDIEDVRQAKRREVVERAKDLLATAFDEDLLSSAELIEEVRESVRVERIGEYEDLPAGPRVGEGDAVIVVEGRADVLTLLKYGVKNAVAVEGTNVPEAVADLTRDRTVTAFLDGDRGGDLILRELAQVGEVDYVAFAPEGRSVEDLARHEVLSALREKVPFEAAMAEVGDGDATGDAASPTADDSDGAATAATDGSATPAPDADDSTALPDAPDSPSPEPDRSAPPTLADHVEAAAANGVARFLDADLDAVGEAPEDEVVSALAEADPVPATVVLPGTVTLPVLAVAAQRGVGRVVGRELGEFTKQPAGVRVLLAEDITAPGA